MSIVSRLGRLAARMQIKAAMATALPGAPPAPKPPPVPKPIPAAPPPMPVTPPPMPAAPPKMPVLGGSVAPPQPAPVAKAPEPSYGNPAFVEARRLEDMELAEKRRMALGQQSQHNSDYMRSLVLSRRQSADSMAQTSGEEGSDEAMRLDHQMGELQAEDAEIRRTLPPGADLPPDIWEDIHKRERELLQGRDRLTSGHAAQRKQLEAFHNREVLRSKRLN